MHRRDPDIGVSTGRLIVFEGIDGVGKSTQVGALKTWLEAIGHEVVRSKEPTDGPHGRKLRQSMAQGRLEPREELDLFLADRRQHVEELIAPALNRGAIVILDRYYFSTVAYQGARGFDPSELRAENEEFAPPPDLLVILDMPACDAIDRIRESRGGSTDTFESFDALKRSRSIFLSLGEDLPFAVVLDARASPEVIQAAVRRSTAPLLPPLPSPETSR